MARLSTEMGLSSNLITRLNQNQVFTILDYLQEDCEKLSSICDTLFKDILEIRKKLITNFSALSLGGSSAYQYLLSSSALITTGIKSLDEMLGGGLLTGTVCELCGGCGDGKTQLCFALAAHVAAVLKQTVYYVDTKGDFSALRVQNILKNKNLPPEEIGFALERISVKRIENIYELANFLNHVKKSYSEEETSNLRLVIIDSMPPLFFPFMGSNTFQGFGLLNYVMATMKSLATEHHILIVEVNIASTYFDPESREREECEEDREQTVNEPRPMLGKYWLHAPNTRLFISRLNNDAPQRLIRVTKSTNVVFGASCVVCVNQNGVV